MINVANLSVSIGERNLLSDVSLVARPGEVTGLIGPNGAGKSTLLAAIAGDIDYTGSVSLVGQDPAVSSPGALARARAVMLQDVTVSFQFRVGDVGPRGGRPWEGTARQAEDDAIIDAALAAVDATHLAGRDIATLSGGERARVALARVLAQQTPVILLDEPTAALDIRHQEQVLGLVRSIAAQAGVAVLVVLHDLGAAAAYCDHIVCLADGAVAAAGPVREVYTDEILSQVYRWPIQVREADGHISVHPARRQTADPEQSFVYLLKES